VGPRLFRSSEPRGEEVPMTATPFYVTTSIPYVNSRPHLGFALEIVQADVLARHHRLRGDRVRFQTGTDDNSLTNVRAAEAEGVPVQRLVDRNAAAFVALRGPLSLSFDDFIRTSSRPAPPRWDRAAMAGVRRRRRPLPQALRGAVLRRLRAVLHGGGASRRPLPRPRPRAGAGRRGELVLPALPLPGAAAPADG
jgi:hypothetical protein